MEKLYRDLVDLPGAPSFEKPVREYMRQNLEPYVDEIIEDKLGSIFGVINKGSIGPKVMIAGHMDEVGGIVTGIEKTGLISVTNLGGMHGNTYLGQHFDIITDDLEKIPGVSASRPPHLLRGTGEKPKDLEYKDLKIDIGADNKEHAQELGVKIGQQVISRNDFTVTKDGKKFISKAWDDRFGCGMSLELARDIEKENLECELYLGATVQEEVGLRGAKTAAGLVKPDVFIAVDCSPCADTFDGDEVSGSLGEGFMVRFYDPRAIMHQGMKKFITELADEHGVKYQYYKSMGGTDAARVQLANDGVLVATVGMPARYIHSNTSMIHGDDHKEVKKILTHIIKTINEKVVAEIKKNV
jgi:putative aminopeptidase FrvX